MNDTWRNPYQAKRGAAQRPEPKETKGRKNAEAPQPPPVEGTPQQRQDMMLQVQGLREGIRGLSSSIQQVEKTMESITQMFQTMEKVGGMMKLDQFLSPPSAGATRGGAVHPMDQMKRFIGMLEKIDFKQVNQILDSPLFQNLLSSDPKKGGKEEG